MPWIEIYNRTRALQRPIRAAQCVSFGERLQGLMFKKNIARYEGLLIIQATQSRINAAIHMFFMNFNIAVIWLDRQQKVVDARLARRWRPYYAPSSPATYILETHPEHLTDFQIGDQLDFKNV